MTTDPTAGARAALGARCREILNSDTFKSAIGAVSADFERRILTGKPEDTAKREQLFLEYHALKRVVARLHQWESDGQIASKEIERDT